MEGTSTMFLYVSPFGRGRHDGAKLGSNPSIRPEVPKVPLSSPAALQSSSPGSKPEH